MKPYASQHLRNVCFVGAQGDGKTSLAETLLFNAGGLSRMGSVAEGTAVCDHTDEEVARKISIALSIAFFEHQEKKVNLLVTPGYPDFIGDVYEGLAAAESALFVMSADSGLSHSGENIWEYLEKSSIPAAVFLNKLDKENINLCQAESSYKNALNKKDLAQVFIIS